MKKIIEDLYKIDRYLLGEGFDKSLEYINNIIPLEINGVKSGTEVGTWIVPEEWVMRDGWVKFNGEKILDWKTDPLSVVVGSLPIHATMGVEEFKKNLHVSDEVVDAIPYTYMFYDKEWGFCMPKNKVMKHVVQKCEGGICTDELEDIDPSIGQVMIDGSITPPKFQDVLPEGEYEVFIDSEYKPGVLKWGVHTIPGKSKKEILIFAHLDHPWQANDNLSGVACLVDMAGRLKEQGFEHTIKLIFCAETIGSVAYAETEDISNVEFVVAVDAVGNDNTLLLQKSYDAYSRLNYAMHLACSDHATDYRKGDFRMVVGSDEYYFNDPRIGIPGIMLSRIPYKEYHTSHDTPEIINEEKIKQVQDTIIRIISIYERDFIPDRVFVGPLMRSRYDVQTPHKLLNRDLDYLFYRIDGKRYLSDIVISLGLGFEFGYSVLEKLENDGLIKKNTKSCGANACKGEKQKTCKQKCTSTKRKTNVANKPRKVS